MSTTSGPLSPLPSVPWPSLSLPITITLPGTVVPSTNDSSVAVTSTITPTPAPTSSITTQTGIIHNSTSLTHSLSTSTTVMSSGTVATHASTSSSTTTSARTSLSQTSSPSSSSVTRSEVSSGTGTASSTPLVGTLAPAPSDDTGTTGGSGPTVTSAEEEISHLKETRNIVIAVLSALALVAVLVAVRAVYLRRRSAPSPAPLPHHKSPGPLLTADTPVGGVSQGAPWPFVTVSEWQPPQLNRLSPPPRPHYTVRDPSNRASILPQTVDAWISGAGSSSVDLRSQHTPLPSPAERHAYRPGYI